MRKEIAICFLLIFSASLIVAEDNVFEANYGVDSESGPVHQYLAVEAGRIWKVDEFESYLSDSYLSCDPIDGNKNDIVEGACEEDSLRGCPYDSCEFGSYTNHFWDPDNFDNGNYNSGLIGDSSYFIAQFYWDNYVIPYYYIDKDKSYYYLGRVSHLIADATVPAHVHLDEHATKDDSYEDFMSLIDDSGENIWGEMNLKNFEHFDGRDYSGGFYRYESLDFWDENVKSDASDLFKLFWFTAQKTQHFASDDYDGNNKFVFENGSVNFFNPLDYDYLWEFDTDYSSFMMVKDKDNLADDDGYWSGVFYYDSDWGSDLEKIAESNVPHAMKAISGLYRLFWIETHEVSPCDSGGCCDWDLKITLEEEQPPNYADGYYCSGNDVVYSDFYCETNDPDSKVNRTFVKSCDGVCQYCSAGYEECENYEISHMYDSDFRCSSGVGRGRYGDGGEYLCQGFCDGDGGRDYADNCEYSLECDKDDDNDGFCELGYFIQNFSVQCFNEVGSSGTDCDDSNFLINIDRQELCNGIDDNCNGEIDEDCICVENETRSCGTQMGQCESGIQTCDIFGVWGECFDLVGPSDEICTNGLDDDCDGKIDCADDDCRGLGDCFGICTIHSPFEDEIYDDRRILFNISASEKLSEILYLDYSESRPKWRTLCRRCEGYEKEKGFTEGLHDIDIKCISYIGEEEVQEFNFVNDYRDPKILKILPNKNSIVSGSGFYVRYNEENVREVSVVIDSYSYLLNCSSGRNEECFIDLNLTDYDGEEIEYYFMIEDVANNIDVSKIMKVEVDTSSPILNNEDIFWAQGVGRYARYIYFELNISEENFDKASYTYVDTRGRFGEKKLCGRLKDGLCEAKKSFRNGDKVLGVRIVDKAGNTASYPIEYFVEY